MSYVRKTRDSINTQNIFVFSKKQWGFLLELEKTGDNVDGGELVFGTNVSPSNEYIYTIWRMYCMVLDGEAQLMKRPSSCQIHTRQNQLICDSTLYIAITFEPIIQFQNIFGFRRY